MLSEEATNTNFIVFGLTRPGLDSTFSFGVHEIWIIIRTSSIYLNMRLKALDSAIILPLMVLFSLDIKVEDRQGGGHILIL